MPKRAEDYFENEEKLLDEHGDTLTFQLHRVDLEAKTIAALQGERLAEIRVAAGFASGTDTVATVKAKLLTRLADHGPAATIREGEWVTLFFSGRPMQDDKLFYADHFMLLPVWVQVILHDAEIADVIARAQDLASAAGGS